MRYQVKPQDVGSIRLNEKDTVSAVLQNIAIILTTLQQQVPLYRDFGLPGRFIDKPMNVARPILIAEVQEAIRAFEPRATLRNITFQTDPASPGKLIPTVEVDITDE